MARTSGRRVREFREEMKAGWQPRNAPCGICGQDDIDWDGDKNQPDSFELDHILPVISYPDLEFVPTNAQPAHHRCNRSKGAGKTFAEIGTTSEEW